MDETILIIRPQRGESFGKVAKIVVETILIIEPQRGEKFGRVARRVLVEHCTFSKATRTGLDFCHTLRYKNGGQ